MNQIWFLVNEHIKYPVHIQVRARVKEQLDNQLEDQIWSPIGDETQVLIRDRVWDQLEGLEQS